MPHTMAMPEQPLPPPPAPGPGAEVAAAEGDAEQALRQLEAEWAVRMEAPLAALAQLEDELTRAIDDAAKEFPLPGTMYPPPS